MTGHEHDERRDDPRVVELLEQLGRVEREELEAARADTAEPGRAEAALLAAMEDEAAAHAAHEAAEAGRRGDDGEPGSSVGESESRGESAAPGVVRTILSLRALALRDPGAPLNTLDFPALEFEMARLQANADVERFRQRLFGGVDTAELRRTLGRAMSWRTADFLRYSRFQPDVHERLMHSLGPESRGLAPAHGRRDDRRNPERRKF